MSELIHKYHIYFDDNKISSDRCPTIIPTN